MNICRKVAAGEIFWVGRTFSMIFRILRICFFGRAWLFRNLVSHFSPTFLEVYRDFSDSWKNFAESRQTFVAGAVFFRPSQFFFCLFRNFFLRLPVFYQIDLVRNIFTTYGEIFMGLAHLCWPGKYSYNFGEISRIWPDISGLGIIFFFIWKILSGESAKIFSRFRLFCPAHRKVSLCSGSKSGTGCK